MTPVTLVHSFVCFQVFGYRGAVFCPDKRLCHYNDIAPPTLPYKPRPLLLFLTASPSRSVSCNMQNQQVPKLFSLNSSFKQSIITYYLQGSSPDTNTHNCPVGWHCASVLGDECDDSGGCQYCALFLGFSHYNLQEVLPIQAQSACPHTVTLYTAYVVHCHSKSTVLYIQCLHSC